GVGEASPRDPAWMLANDEQEWDPYTISGIDMHLTAVGLLIPRRFVQRGDHYGGIALVSFDGQLLWTDDVGSGLLSPDGTQMLTAYHGPQEEDLAGHFARFDLKTRKVIPLPIPLTMTVLGWSADSQIIYYADSQQLSQVDGDADSPVAH